MGASALEALGILASCGAAAAALVVDDRRARNGALVAALALAPVLVLGSVWDESRVIDFRTSPAQVGAALLVAGAGIAALWAAFRRVGWLFGVAAFAALPLRVPVEIGGETANLLVPLYLVIAAGVLAVVTERAGPSTARDYDDWALWLRRLLAASVALYGIQALYSDDVANAIENIGFFLVPFSALLVLLLEVEWTRGLLRRVLLAVAAVTLACALVGLYQFAARDLFLNPELYDANQLHVYFRVNSIFFDPNIYARYLAIAITALAAGLAWSRSPRDLAAAAAVGAVALVALAFSYSITGMAALLAGLGTVAVLRWRWRGALAYGALGLAALAALAIAGGTPTSDIEDVRSIDSGHADLIEGGLDLVAERPAAGWGSGAFGRAFYEQIERARTTVSHSEPITVAAEQGVIGFALYAALLVAMLVTLLGRGAADALPRSAVAACFVAMLVSSFGYTGFLIDPVVWALLALGLALRPPATAGRSATI